MFCVCNFIACNNEDDFTTNSCKDKYITIRAEIIDNSKSRIVLGESENGKTKLLWSSNDFITLIDGENTYIFNRVENDTDETTIASFIYRGNEKLPEISKKGLSFQYSSTSTLINYACQPGTEEGLSDYMVMTASIPQNITSWDDLHLSFKHNTAVVKMIINNSAFVDKSVVVSLNATGLFENGRSITSGELTADRKGTIEVYFVVPETEELDDCEIKVNCENICYSTTLDSKQISAGKLYKITKDEIPAVADIVNLTEAGTLTDKIDEERMSVISGLKIIGKINGSDINTLNKMLKLELAYLDLSEAQIIEDGTSYTNNGFTVKTLDDIIGESAFFRASSLEIIYLPNTLKAIESSAFSQSPLLKKVIVTNGLEKIGGGAFSYCTSLEDFIMPNSVTEISSQDAFNWCTSLKKVTLSENITLIPYRTFYGCSNLTEIVFPKKVNYFGQNILQGCRELEKIYIKSEEQVTFEIGFSFSCNNLKEIHFSSPIPPRLKDSETTNIFGSILDKCVIYVPKGSLDTYKDSKIGYFKTIIEDN